MNTHTHDNTHTHTLTDSSSLPSTPYNSNPDMSKPFLDHTSFSGDALTSTVPLVRDPPPTLTLGTPSQAPQPAVNTQVNQIFRIIISFL